MKDCLRSLETTPSTLERTWDAEGVEILRARVTLPQPQGTDRTSRRIRRFYQLQSRSFLRYCESALLPQARAEYDAALAVSSPLRCFSAELTYQVTYNENGLWSLWTLSREVTNEVYLTRRGDAPTTVSSCCAAPPGKWSGGSGRARAAGGRTGAAAFAAALIPGTIT